MSIMILKNTSIKKMGVYRRRRRFKVVATYPNAEIVVGVILTQYFYTNSVTGMYCYVTNIENPLSGVKISHIHVENMPHLFTEIDVNNKTISQANYE